jgi:hypothetical protein
MPIKTYTGAAAFPVDTADDVTALVELLGRTATDERLHNDLGDHFAYVAGTHPEWFRPHQEAVVTQFLDAFRFYRRCAESSLPELERLATTVQTWWPADPGVHPHRDHQRRLRGHQPGDQDRRQRRVWLPQPRQPATTQPLRHHPASPRTPRPPLTSLSRAP